MVAIVRRNWILAKFISSTSNKNILKCLTINLTSDQTRFVCEVVLNVLLGNIRITEHYKKKLKPKKQTLLKLVSKSISDVQRRRLYTKYHNLVRDVIAASVDVLAEVSV